MNKVIAVEVGDYIQRTMLSIYDNPDGFINSIKDSLFEVIEVTENNIEVRCIASRNFPSAGTTLGMPYKYLNDLYFVRVERFKV